MTDTTFERKNLFGRKVIYSEVDTITDNNIVEVMANALSTHGSNAGDIEYLYNFYLYSIILF